MANKISRKVQAVIDSSKSILDERFSGYVLVGFVAGCDTPVTIVNIDGSEMRRNALIPLLQDAGFALQRSAEEIE